MARSPRKLKKITPSPSSMAATGAPSGFPHGERRQHLVTDAGLLGPEVLHRGRRAVKSRGLTQDVGTPAPGDDAPVGSVPVHGHHHPAAPGGDAVVAGALAADLAQQRFQSLEVDQRRTVRDVAPVQQGVHVEPRQPFPVCAADEGVEVGLVGMHVAVGEQPHEVQGATAGPDPPHQGLPVAVPHGSGADGAVDALGALVEDPARAHDVVPHLGVSDVGVRGQPHRGAVSPQRRRQTGAAQQIEVGRPRQRHRVELVPRADPDTIKNEKHHRPPGRGQDRVPAQPKRSGIAAVFHVHLPLPCVIPASSLRHSRTPSLRHSRESGNPGGVGPGQRRRRTPRPPLDSRFRGNDGGGRE